MKTILYFSVNIKRIIKNSWDPLAAFLLLFFTAGIAVAHVNSVAAASVADLSVSNFTVSPQTLYAGTHLNAISFRLTNLGPSDLVSPNTRVSAVFYLSKNNIFGDSDDIPIGTNSNDYSIPSSTYLNVTLSETERANVTIPSTASGTYYLFIQVQHSSPSTLTDNTPGNNYVIGANTISVVNLATDADLAALNFTFFPQTINAGAHPDGITFRLVNNGPNDLVSPNTQVNDIFYLSRNSTFGDDDDIQIGITGKDYNLESGSYTDLTLSSAELNNITIPASAIGSYYVFIRVQHASPSKLTDPTPHNDYAVRAGTITVVNTSADLALSGLTFLPETIDAGTNPTGISFRITNNGPADLAAPNTRVNGTLYLSRNSILGDDDDILIGQKAYDFPLAATNYFDITLSAGDLTNITIPATASGSYYVFLKVQHGSPSVLTDPVSANNSVMKVGTITVMNTSFQADLAASNLSFLPQTINAGANPDAVSFRLSNNGPSNLSSTNTKVEEAFFLSRNNVFGDADDIQIGVNNNDYIVPSATNLDITLTAAEKSNITIPSTASGSYYVFVRVHNTTPSILTDPVSGNDYTMRVGTISVLNSNFQADLAAMNFTFSSQTLNAGTNPDAVSFDLVNNGPANLASPNTQVDGSFYLSRNDAFGDADDIQIGSYTHDFTVQSGTYVTAVLSAAERSNITIPFSASGSYYVFVKVQHSSSSGMTDPVPGNNYTMRVGTITVINSNYRADLAISNFKFGPQIINAGSSPESVTFRLANYGPNALINLNTRVDETFYISRNSLFGDDDDIQVGVNSKDYLLLPLSYSDDTLLTAERSKITIPANAIGSYYVFAKVQHSSPSVLTDPVSTNNYVIMTGTITVVNNSSDLAVSNLTFSPQTIVAGKNPDAVSFRLTNNGPSSLSTPNTRVNGVFYLSANNIFGDADDIQIGSISNDFTLSSASYADVNLSAADRANITIPVTLSGDYYVFVKVQHGSPSVYTDPTPANNSAQLTGTIKVVVPCNLSVSSTSLSFTSATENKVINITSNTSWTVTDNADWITVSPASGNNNGTLTVTVAQNTGNSRTGIVSVAGCEKTVQIDVQQDGLTTRNIREIQGVAYTSPYAGTYQRISGTISGVIPGVGYFVQDAVAAWSGIYVADTYDFVLEGNGITVDGTIQEVNGVTTMNAAHAQLMNPPLTVTPLLLGSPEEAKSEQYEGVLVKVAGARFQGTPNQDGSWDIKTTESNKVTVDKLIYASAPVDGHFYNVTGIVNGSSNNVYKIEPRKSSDIYDLSINTPSAIIEDPDVMVYPNPFNDHLNISNSDKLARLTVTNITGQLEMDILHPQSEINTSSLINGIYVIRLYSNSGLILTRKLVKK